MVKRPLKGRRAKRRKPANKGTHAQKRVNFLLYVLKRTPAKLATEAAQAAGIGSARQAKTRVIAHLQEHMSLDDAQRNVKPRVFTAEVLDEALEELIKSQKPLTAAALIAELVSNGVLSSPQHDTKHFIRCLREHAKVKGWHVQSNSTKTESYLAPTDPKARTAYCDTVLKVLDGDSQALRTLVFMDETSILENEHPKGGPCLHAVTGCAMLACASWSWGFTCCCCEADAQVLLIVQVGHKPLPVYDKEKVLKRERNRFCPTALACSLSRKACAKPPVRQWQDEEASWQAFRQH
jgi:hypothetical protein